ncbi:unnamed protein product, partial [Musa hybrid cultivar]
MDKANPEGSRSNISCPLIIITIIPCWNIPRSITLRCRDQDAEGCRHGHLILTLPHAITAAPSLVRSPLIGRRPPMPASEKALQAFPSRASRYK